MGFSNAEKEHYAHMAGIIVGDDEEKKQRLDSNTRKALASVRASMPQADDQMLVLYFASVVIVLAQVLGASFQDAAGIAETVFNNYTLAAASIMGVYKLDGETPAQTPEADAGADAARAREMELLMNRAYL